MGDRKVPRPLPLGELPPPPPPPPINAGRAFTARARAYLERLGLIGGDDGFPEFIPNDPNYWKFLEDTSSHHARMLANICEQNAAAAAAVDATRRALPCAQVYHLVDDPARQVQVLHLMPAQTHGYAVLALPASTRGVVIDHGLDRDEAELVAQEARATILRLRADPKEAIRRG